MALVASVLRLSRLAPHANGFTVHRAAAGIRHSSTFVKRAQIFLPTTKETPVAHLRSHQLMLRAGLIHQSGAGLYSFLPLGLRVLNKLAAIVDDELANAQCQKLSMPTLLAADLWKKSGRWSIAGNELLRLKNRNGADMCLLPTHEEVVTDLVAHYALSYKHYPLRLYQIGHKYRDEIRPRFGLMRAVEFIMKDLYTFDTSPQAASDAYDVIANAYLRIFERLHLPVALAEADTGMIGGNRSHEVHVLSSVGEDVLLRCEQCSYTANVEKAVSNLPSTSIPQPTTAFWERLLHDPERALKAEHPNEPVQLVSHTSADADADAVADAAKSAARIVVVPAHRKTNSIKISKFLADGLVDPTAVLVDNSLTESVHPSLLSRVALGDFIDAQEGDACVCGTGELHQSRGIEVGHLFYLGTKYSKALELHVSDGEGTRPVEMGCFGLGMTRIMASIVEVHNDTKGIMWPEAVAPYRVCIVTAPNRAAAETDAELLTMQQLSKIVASRADLKGEVVLDDRSDVSFGAKMAEAELIGYPWIVIIGKTWEKEQKLEVHQRSNGQKHKVSMHELPAMFSTNPSLLPTHQ